MESTHRFTQSPGKKERICRDQFEPRIKALQVRSAFRIEHAISSDLTLRKVKTLTVHHRQMRNYLRCEAVHVKALVIGS